MRVLVVSPYVPYPPRAGGQVRIWNLAKQLAKRHTLDLLAFAESQEEQQRGPLLKPVFQEATLIRRRPTVKAVNLWRGFPARAHEMVCAEMEQALGETLASRKYDVVQLDYTEMAHYADVVGGRAKVSLTEQDVGSAAALRWARSAPSAWARWRGLMNAARMLAYEVHYCERVDRVITVSQHDADLLASYAPRARVVNVPIGVAVEDVRCRAELPAAPGVLFLGYMRHPPNPQGLVYLWRQVMPLVAEQMPQVHLRVVGEGCEWGMENYKRGAYAKLIGDQRVTVVGAVEDLEGEFARNRIMAAPVLSGSGVRVKILTALAGGIPVVSTTLGVEGLLGRAGEHYLIGDTPEKFAECTLRLLRDDDLCRALAVAGRRLVEEHYDWRVIGEQLERIYLEMIGPPPPPKRTTGGQLP